MSPTMSQVKRAQTHHANANAHCSPTSTSTIESELPKLSIRTSVRAFDYLPPELTTPIPHLISPGITAPPPTSNPLTSSLFGMSSQSQTQSRFIPPDHKQLDSLPLIAPAQHLASSLQILTTDHPPSASVHGRPAGLLSGPTSIAYLFLLLSKSHPTLDISTRTPLEWCREYLRAAASSHQRHPHSRAGGIQDEELAYSCVKAAYTQDLAYVRRALSHVAESDLDDSENEWLYGRAGTLYLLRMLKSWCGSLDTQVPAQIDGLTNRLVQEIISFDRSDGDGPRWTWHGKSYLGAAHGDIGIITQLALSAPACVDTALTDRLVGLLDEQLPSGNWPSSRPSAHSQPKHPPQDELVQFCHGAPGFILSLQALLPHFPFLKPRIEDAIRRARDDIWDRGFLAKEPCLCHGVAGNALAMDKVRRERMLRMAAPEVVGRGVGEGWYVPGSDAYGLLWGEAGRAWVWANVERGGGVGMVGYTDV